MRLHPPRRGRGAVRVRLRTQSVASSRVIWRSFPEIEVPEGEWIQTLELSTEAGVLAQIPMSLRHGVNWPPLPFQDLSALNQDYWEKLPVEPD